MSSIAFHLILLSIVILWAATINLPEDGLPLRRGQIVLAVVQHENNHEFFEPEKFERTKTSNSDDSRIVFEESPPPLGASLPLEMAGLRPANAQENLESVAEMVNVATQNLTMKPVELSQSDLDLISNDQQSFEKQKPKGQPTSITVFGSQGIRGRNFVFLIDRSHSMGDQGLGVLNLAIQELTSAVGNLEPNHSFQIVAYNNRTVMMGQRTMLAAVDSNKDHVGNFIASLLAFAGTNHENGIYAALALKPDAIVMLTDGGSPDLNQGQLAMIKNSAGKTQFHTIQFGTNGSPKGPHFLKKLASMTSGTYRYIDVRRFRANNQND